MNTPLSTKVSRFKENVSAIQFPEKFTFPFYYQPHELAVLATKDLQDFLTQSEHWNRYFGLNEKAFHSGKMFGVLVVETADGSLGYLSAFSGKLDNGNHYDKFVPPVFDMLTKDSFFLKEEEIINRINAQIEKLETSEYYLNAQEKLKDHKANAHRAIEEHRENMRQAKKLRKQKRVQSKAEDTAVEHQNVLNSLAKESVELKFVLKDITNQWHVLITEQEHICTAHKQEIDLLRAERKRLSSALQAKLFTKYQFLNQKGEVKNLQEIFTVFNVVPPAGFPCSKQTNCLGLSSISTRRGSSIRPDSPST